MFPIFLISKIVLLFSIKYLFIIAFLFSNRSFSDDINGKNITLKCNEITGTNRNDIFKINTPNFKWYYKGKWYELANSKSGVAKDWNVNFSKNIITLYNYKTKWYRFIDLDKMTASMKFPTGEEYIYNCIYINME